MKKTMYKGFHSVRHIYMRMLSVATSMLLIISMIVVPENVIITANAANVEDMYPVDSTYEFLKSVEGYSPQCFWDAKQWTIGYGNKCPHNHSTNGSKYGQKGGHYISEEEARSLFSEKLGTYVNTLKSNCSGLSMNQNQFDALLSATYNHGNVNKCPLKYYLQGKLSESEARSQYYEWCINKGTSTESSLRNRRKKEADLFFSSSSTVLPTTVDNRNYEIPATVYASHKINTYDSNGNIESSRWIDAGDKCYIDAVYVNDFVHVQYPTGGSTEPNRWSYAKLSDFTDVLPIIPTNRTVSLHAWISDTKMGDCPAKLYTGQPFYLCYELIYTDTRERIPSDWNYSVKETINKPDGSVAHEYTYNNSNNNWIGITPNVKGKYNCKVVASGDINITVDVSTQIYAREATGNLTCDKSEVSLDLCGTNSATVKITANGDLPDSYHFSANRDTSAIETSWGDWSGSSAPITIKGKKTGTYNLKISLVNGETEEVLTDKIITVNITCSHKFGSWSTTKEATSSSDGVKTRSCSVCGKSEQKTIPLISGSLTTDKSEVSLDLCGTNTATVKITANGNLPYSYHFSANRDTSAIETSWGDWSGSSAPITIKGKKTGTYNLKISLVNGETEEVLTDKIITVNITCSHKFGSWSTVQEPRCDSDGVKMRECTICGTKESQSIPHTGHDYVTKTIDPSCESQGYTLHECVKCGESYKDNYKEAYGHHYGMWTVTKDATCTETGMRTRSCTNCGKIETEIIPKREHDYVTSIVEPTSTSQGYTLHKCSLCGDEYKDNYTDMLTPIPDETIPQIVAEEVNGAAGSTVHYRIMIKNNPGIVGIQLGVNYDASALTLQEANCVTFADVSFGPLSSPLSVVWGDSLHGNNMQDGVIADLVFKINDDVALGKHPVSVTYRPGDIIDSSLSNVEFTIVDGSVNVVSSIPGDVNGDGSVNMKDYAILQRYLNNWNVTIVADAVDVNDDGDINMKDYALLQRYLNGWDVQLK